MKRKLTQDEINDIIKEIKVYGHIPEDIREATRLNITNDVREQLGGVSIYPEMIPELKKSVIERYHRSLIQPGESVGIITAQSIGERQTQMTLNSFHSAGLAIATVVTGVPRFTELLSITRNPKSIIYTIYPQEEMKTVKELRELIKNDFVQYSLEDLVKEDGYEIIKGKAEEVWYRPFSILYDVDISEYQYCLRLSIDKDIIYKYHISMKLICDKVMEAYDNIHCVYSPNHIGFIDIFIETDNIQLEQTVAFINENNYINIYIEDVIIPKINQIHICGIENTKQVYFQKHKNNHWFMSLDGGDIHQLLQIPYINKHKLLSNNVWDMYRLCGIEGARQFFIDEFMNVVSSDGTYINQQHVILLVDIMTNSGKLTPVNRYGTTRQTTSIISKASFEESIENFVNAAFFTETEKIDGVSASIMCGVNAKVGTGIIDTIPDLDMIRQIQPIS